MKDFRLMFYTDVLRPTHFIQYLSKEWQPWVRDAGVTMHELQVLEYQHVDYADIGGAKVSSLKFNEWHLEGYVNTGVTDPIWDKKTGWRCKDWKWK